jgi:hypothetical protein
MKRVTFAVFFALLFLGHYSHAQTGACFFAGGPVLDSFGCSTVVVFQIMPGANLPGVNAGISGLFGTDFEASGEITGGFGTATSPCQTFDYGIGPISIQANVGPGVYTLNVTFTGCGVESAFGPWTGQVTIVVLPPNPATAPPPPTCSALLIDPVQSGLL